MTPKQESDKVAVIILNWNGAKLLREFLPSVVANTPDDIATVIVADNGSTDDSRKVLETEFPQVKRLYFDENLGFAGGYNKAIELTKYKYTVLLNSDVETPEGWLRPMYEYMEQNPAVGACQPKILSYNNKTRFEYAGASGGFIDCNGYPYCRGRIFGVCEEDKGQYDNIISIDWATGAALMVRSNLYLEVGGLDTDFFAHMEEIDLCWRIRLAGKEIVVVPQSHVYHLGGGSLPADNPRKTYLNFRNNLLLLHKNLPDAKRKHILNRRRLLDTIAWAKFIATFDFKNAGAVWRSHRHFAKMRKNYKKHPTQNLLRETPNILVNYYIKNRKTYNELES